MLAQVHAQLAVIQIQFLPQRTRHQGQPALPHRCWHRQLRQCGGDSINIDGRTQWVAFELGLFQAKQTADQRIEFNQGLVGSNLYCMPHPRVLDALLDLRGIQGGDLVKMRQAALDQNGLFARRDAIKCRREFFGEAHSGFSLALVEMAPRRGKAVAFERIVGPALQITQRGAGVGDQPPHQVRRAADRMVNGRPIQHRVALRVFRFCHLHGRFLQRANARGRETISAP